MMPKLSLSLHVFTILAVENLIIEQTQNTEIYNKFELFDKRPLFFNKNTQDLHATHLPFYLSLDDYIELDYHDLIPNDFPSLPVTTIIIDAIKAKTALYGISETEMSNKQSATVIEAIYTLYKTCKLTFLANSHLLKKTITINNIIYDIEWTHDEL